MFYESQNIIIIIIFRDARGIIFTVRHFICGRVQAIVKGTGQCGTDPQNYFLRGTGLDICGVDKTGTKRDTAGYRDFVYLKNYL